MSNVTIAPRNRQNEITSVSSLSESKVIQAEAFAKSQSETFTQNHANDVLSMYQHALLYAGFELSATYRSVFDNILQAHYSFADVVDPIRFDARLETTVEDEFILTRKAASGGRVMLVIDEDLLTFSYLPQPMNRSAEILKFHYPDQMSAVDYKNLMYRFFEL